jgi:hypothetical protein
MQPDQPSDKPQFGVEPTGQVTIGQIDAAAYNAIIEQVHPLDIRLTHIDFSLKSPVHSGPLVASAQLEAAHVANSQPDMDGKVRAEITQRAHFRIRSADESIAAEGLAEFSIRLRLGFEPPKSFWDLFCVRNVKLYTHPMLRDLVAGLCARASLVVQPMTSISVTQSVQPELLGQLKKD